MHDVCYRRLNQPQKKTRSWHVHFAWLLHRDDDVWGAACLAPVAPAALGVNLKREVYVVSFSFCSRITCNIGVQLKLNALTRVACTTSGFLEFSGSNGIWVSGYARCPNNSHCCGVWTPRSLWSISPHFVHCWTQEFSLLYASTGRSFLEGLILSLKMCDWRLRSAAEGTTRHHTIPALELPRLSKKKPSP